MQIREDVGLLDRVNIILSDLHLAQIELEQGKIIPAWKRVVSALEHLSEIKRRIGGE